MANIALQKKKKYHIIYKTTNMVNKKIYIGAHSTDSLDDGYLGSGYNITESIKKYGRQNFERTILHIFTNPEEMFAKEKEIVCKDFLKQKNVYNIVEGGNGGINKGATGLKHMHHIDSKIRIAVHPNAIEKMKEQGFILGRGTSSTSNTIWVHNAHQKKMIEPKDLESYIKSGWIRGLPESPTKNKIWIFNELAGEYSLCSESELPIKLSAGWVVKKWSPIQQGETMWVNNGSNNLRIKKNLLEFYKNNNWKEGMLQVRKNIK